MATKNQRPTGEMLISTQSPRNSHLALKSIHYQKGCIELYPSTAQDLVSDLALYAMKKQLNRKMQSMQQLKSIVRCCQILAEDFEATSI
uniref:Uncharacterized protein n=1 Tax=Setaria italica TaxID=4555 RepID=K3YZI2_SETIT